MTAAETPDDPVDARGGRPGGGAHGEPGGGPADVAVETIQREMTAFARRARASAGRMHPELSDRKSTRLNSSHSGESRMPSSA